MKTLKQAYELSIDLDKLANSVPVNDLNNPVGIVLYPLHEKIYQALLNYTKPFYIEWALFEREDGTHTAYADVVYEKNPNMKNFCFGVDGRDIKPRNVLSLASRIERFKKGEVQGLFGVFFMSPIEAYMVANI